MKTFKEFLSESAPPSKKAEDWIKANKEEFKQQYGDSWEEVLYATAWKMFGAKEDTTTAGVALPDSPIKVSRFMGHDCIDLDEDEYNTCISGKQPFERWSNYIENESRRCAIQSAYHKSKKLIVRNEKTGAMSFLKR